MPRALARSIATALACAVLLLAGRDAHAFCGFYVSGADDDAHDNATQVVLMRDGTRTVLSMQNNYQGPPQDFAMVVPVPVVLQKENVKTLPREVFDHVDTLTAPRLVEYWEQDPCPPADGVVRRRAAGAAGSACGHGPARRRLRGAALGVKIEAKFTRRRVRHRHPDRDRLDGARHVAPAEQLQDPRGRRALLRPYVQRGMKFFVAKVDRRR